MTTEKPAVSTKPNIGPRSPIKHNFENPILPNPNSHYEDVQFKQVSPPAGQAKSPLEKKIFKQIFPKISVNTIQGKRNALNYAGGRRPSAKFDKFEPPVLQVKQDDDNQPDAPETPTSPATSSAQSSTSPPAASPQSPTSPTDQATTGAPSTKPRPQTQPRNPIAPSPQTKPVEKLPPQNKVLPQNKTSPSPPQSTSQNKVPQRPSFRDQPLPSKVNLPSGVLIMQPFKVPPGEVPNTPERVPDMVTRKAEVIGEEIVYDNSKKIIYTL